MKILLLVIGKTDSKALDQLTQSYRKRIKHFINFEYIEIPDVPKFKKISEVKQRQLETEAIIKRLPNNLSSG